jgi:hypothetical protein
MQPVSTRSISPGAELALLDVAAGVAGSTSRRPAALHDEPSPPKNPAPSRFWNAMPSAHALRRAQERVLLRDQLAADLARCTG